MIKNKSYIWISLVVLVFGILVIPEIVKEATVLLTSEFRLLRVTGVSEVSDEPPEELLHERTDKNATLTKRKRSFFMVLNSFLSAQRYLFA